MGSWSQAVVRGWLLRAGWGAGIGYPGLVLDAEGDEVPGFVLASHGLDSEWQRLDAFEGADYARVVTRVRLASGLAVNAYVYVVRHSVG